MTGTIAGRGKTKRFKKSTAGTDPVALFRRWYENSINSAKGTSLDVNAVSLATATPDGRPSVRMVLLRQFSADGFDFFTHYESRKGNELAANPRASMLFYDPFNRRQVRINGMVARMDVQASDEFFQRQPFRHKLSAWASPQSHRISAKQLDQNVSDLEERFQDRDIQRPQNWGGYRLHPTEFEFWQHRPDRLHDRIVFELQTEGEQVGQWNTYRIAP